MSVCVRNWHTEPGLMLGDLCFVNEAMDVCIENMLKLDLANMDEIQDLVVVVNTSHWDSMKRRTQWESKHQNGNFPE